MLPELSEVLNWITKGKGENELSSSLPLFFVCLSLPPLIWIQCNNLPQTPAFPTRMENVQNVSPVRPSFLNLCLPMKGKKYPLQKNKWISCFLIKAVIVILQNSSQGSLPPGFWAQPGAVLFYSGPGSICMVVSREVSSLSDIRVSHERHLGYVPRW